MSTLTSYLTVANNLTKWQTITSKSASVATQNSYFQKNIGSVTSASQLVNNPRLFNYAMTAFGLGNMTYAKSMMQKVLEQGTTSSTALANTLNNPQILAFAQAFDFAGKGSSLTQSQSFVTDVVNRYNENALELTQGKQNPAVELALYFQQHAPNVKDVYGILGDKNLLKVVQTTLNLSPYMSLEPIDSQYQLLSNKINVADFQDPKKLQAFVSRFCAMNDYNLAGGTQSALTVDPSASLIGVANASTATAQPTSALLANGSTASLLTTANASAFGTDPAGQVAYSPASLFQAF
jgi:Protein of unknown function (DUF1217)